MSEHAVPAFDSEPDADLVEYVVVTMPDVGQLDAVVPTVGHLLDELVARPHLAMSTTGSQLAPWRPTE